MTITRDYDVRGHALLETRKLPSSSNRASFDSYDADLWSDEKIHSANIIRLTNNNISLAKFSFAFIAFVANLSYGRDIKDKNMFSVIAGSEARKILFALDTDELTDEVIVRCLRG